MGSGEGRVGVLCPNIATVGFYCISYPLAKQKNFYVISLRNKTQLGRSDACGYYLELRVAGKTTLSAAWRRM